MAYYSDEVIDSVREANDIVDVAGQVVKLKRQGDNYFGLCPFHNEKTPSFSVVKSKQIFYCFGCGAGGNVIKFIQRYENLSFPEAIEYLADRAGINLPKRQQSRQEKERADRRTRLLEINKEAAKYFYRLLRSRDGKLAYDYFKGRGLSDETMISFGLGYSDRYSDDLYRYLKHKGYPDDILRDSGLVTIDEQRGGRDKFWNRAMFPIMDANSKVIAFGGRVMGEGEPKYLNSPETQIFKKSRTLYGLNIAKRSKKDYFILCEGYMDVIALHQAGFDNAVASLGTAFTEGHAAVVKRYVSKVYLSYDSDGAGRKAALRAIPILGAAGITSKVISMAPYKDPDELIAAEKPEEYALRIEKAQNSFLFRIRMLSEGFDLKDPDEKSRFAEAVADRILEFEEEIERNNYIQAVAGAYGMSADSLNTLVRHRAAAGLNIRKTPSQEIRPRRTGDIRRERGDIKSQKLLLKWLCEDGGLYDVVKGYLQPEDFDEGCIREVAEEMFRTFEDHGQIRPDAIVSRYSDEQADEVASIFFSDLEGIEESEDDDKLKAVSEIIIRLRRDRIIRLSEQLDPNDGAGFQRLIEEKRILEEMERDRVLRRENG